VATTTAGAAAITAAMAGADTGSRPRTGRVRLRYLTPLLVM
jgi:hypothetical protein